MQYLNLKLIKALVSAGLLAVHGFTLANAYSFTESPKSQHCLLIQQLEFADVNEDKLPEFDWLRQKLTATTQDAIKGTCLSSSDIDKLLSRTQQILIEKGFVTTRVLFRNKRNDRLVLTIVPDLTW